MKLILIKSKVSSLLLITILVASIYLGIYSIYSDNQDPGGYSESINTYENSQLNEFSVQLPVSPKSAGTHAPIDLNGDMEVDAFFSSNGTDGLSWATAHVFNDSLINETSAYQINLENTRRYIIFENCTFENAYSYNPSFWLTNTSNVRITNCSFFLTKSQSIIIENCSNIQMN